MRRIGVAWLLTDVSSAIISSRLRSMVKGVRWEVGERKKEREKKREGGRKDGVYGERSSKD